MRKIHRNAKCGVHLFLRVFALINRLQTIKEVNDDRWPSLLLQIKLPKRKTHMNEVMIVNSAKSAESTQWKSMLDPKSKPQTKENKWGAFADQFRLLDSLKSNPARKCYLLNEEVSHLGLVNAGTNKNAGKRICGLQLMRWLVLVLPNPSVKLPQYNHITIYCVNFSLVMIWGM